MSLEMNHSRQVIVKALKYTIHKKRGYSFFPGPSVNAFYKSIYIVY